MEDPYGYEVDSKLRHRYAENTKNITTHLLAHSITQITHSITQITHSLNHSLTQPLIQSLTQSHARSKNSLNLLILLTHGMVALNILNLKPH